MRRSTQKFRHIRLKSKPTECKDFNNGHKRRSISLQSVRISTTDIKGERPLEANRNKDLMIILDNSDMISAG